MDEIWALSGGIACGKSTVAALLRARGAQVIDADDIAREVVEPGTDGLNEIVARFGDAVLLSDGRLDRTALGDRVFGDDKARQALNAMLHPKIFMRSIEHMQAALAKPERPIFYDAALLVENGSYQNFKGLVIVASSMDIQRERLMQRNDLSYEQAQQRMDAQLPIEDKVAVADHVIWNNDDLAALEQRVDALIATLRADSTA